MQTRGEAVEHARSLLMVTHGQCQDATDLRFEKHILTKLRRDEIGELAISDSLILRLGRMMFSKYDVSQAQWIRYSMREMARLLRQLQELSPDQQAPRDLESFLDAQKFDLIISAVENLVSVNWSGRQIRNFDTPSLALKIGISLKKCIIILRGLALRSYDFEKDSRLSAFLTVSKLEWEHKISSIALKTMRIRRLNRPETLPLTEDLIRLNGHIKKVIEKLINEVAASPSRENYILLGQATLARVILFNKRRSGEAARMRLDEYEKTTSEENSEELKKSLTELEVKLSQRFRLIQIIGKRFRPVPVLLDDLMRTAIDVLIIKRREIKVSENNPYVFARPYYNSEGYLSGSCAIKRSRKLKK